MDSQHPALQPQNPHFVSPDFPRTLHHLSLTLHPLVSMSTGQPHSAFPNSILQYHLLSSSDLDALAQHYHQTAQPSHYTSQYPRQVPSWEGKNVELETKRRRFGRFIGMRGCETPTTAIPIPNTITNTADNREGQNLEMTMDREWEEMMRRSRGGDEEEALRRKTMGFW